MGFLEAVKNGFWKYSEFSGRASRAEFWLWHLFILILFIISSKLDSTWFAYKTSGSEFLILYLTEGSAGIVDKSPALIFLTSFIVTFIPRICVSIRRLHDIGLSGYWLLLELTGIGYLLLIYWFIVPGDKKSNIYGDVPNT